MRGDAGAPRLISAESRDRLTFGIVIGSNRVRHFAR
jgi:hypothetical protein